jgi:hypothetical protein
MSTHLKLPIGVNIIVWGIVLMCHAATHSFAAFFVLRFLLGELGSLCLHYYLV